MESKRANKVPWTSYLESNQRQHMLQKLLIFARTQIPPEHFEAAYGPVGKHVLEAVSSLCKVTTRRTKSDADSGCLSLADIIWQ